MRELASLYLEYFEFELSAEGVLVRLHNNAPPALLELVRGVGALDDPALLVCVYEGLCCVAESDSPFSCEIDGKVCPPGLFYQMLDELMRVASGG